MIPEQSIEKMIEKEAIESAHKALYLTSDKVVFETTHWNEFNDYVNGYKAGRSKSIEEKDKEIERLIVLIKRAHYLSVCDLPDEEQDGHWQLFARDHNLPLI